MSKACCEMQLQRFRSMHYFLDPAFLAGTKFGCFLVTLPLKKISGYCLAGGRFLLASPT